MILTVRDNKQKKDEAETSERRNEMERKKRVKEVNGLATTPTPWLAATSVPEEKAERITPYPHPNQSNSPLTQRRPASHSSPPPQHT